MPARGASRNHRETVCPLQPHRMRRHDTRGRFERNLHAHRRITTGTGTGVFWKRSNICTRERAIGEIYRVDARIGGYGHPGVTGGGAAGPFPGASCTTGGCIFWSTRYRSCLRTSSRSSGFTKTGFWADETPWKEDTNEDVACAVVRFDNGAWLSLYGIVARVAIPGRGQLEISGTGGTYTSSTGARTR